jgi:toxin-antitoxin system PIN domain toxin
VTTFLLDVNVLIALSLPTHQHHAVATAWFDVGRTWATTPLTEAGYLRLMVNPRVVGFEIGAAQALAALRTMRSLDGHVFLVDDTSLVEPAIDPAPMVGTRQVTDFHLVNLAATHELVFATFDAGLRRTVTTTDRRHIQVIDG